ncbi:MAG: hypothetical protein CBARDCOR_3232 [uncultured Caballeronia sp.]|nr:MAG: hypothetical protein CBARDCOR_3232 [uncultured Caballeronia sp.]
MKRIAAPLALIAVALGVAVLAAGCNTVHGFGEPRMCHRQRNQQRG